MPEQAATVEDTPEEAPARQEAVPGISPFDIDWLMMLAFAMLADLITAGITLFGIIDLWTISTGVAIAVDGFFFVIIGGWAWWRTSEMGKSKRQQQEATIKRMEDQIQKLQKIGQKEGAQAAEQGLKVAQKALAGLARKAFVKALARFGAVLLGKIIPIIGIIPFWTISVFSMLWEKGE
mgnify:FL=1